ncbi:MAG: hypothetical protein KIT31_32140 [Deltaproteobacteria bacterium]|nr:hypothetical protein [Deltaproteobacteria bacterium]
MAKSKAATRTSSRKPAVSLPALPLGANGIAQGAFAAGEDAAGLAALRPGFGRTAEDDRLFALGWPHLVYLVPGDATAKQLASPKVFSAAHPWRSGEVPAGAAPRMVRFAAAFGDGTAAEKAAIRSTGPIDDAEGFALARGALGWQFGDVMVYLLEALRGSPWVLAQLVAALEQLAPTWSDHSGWLEPLGAQAITALRYVLLRVSAADAAAARKRLAAVAKSARAGELDRAHLRLVELLSPAKADKEVANLTFVEPRDLRARVLAELRAFERGDAPVPDARWVFLAGDAVLDALLARVRDFDREQRAVLARHFARIAHPRAAELVRAAA